MVEYFIVYITSKYDGRALIGTWEVIRTNTATFNARKCADYGCLGTMVSLLVGLILCKFAIPLDNRENKNLRNVCLSQIHEKIFPRKFLLKVQWE